jgi:hypothetical protein
MRYIYIDADFITTVVATHVALTVGWRSHAWICCRLIAMGTECRLTADERLLCWHTRRVRWQEPLTGCCFSHCSCVGFFVWGVRWPAAADSACKNGGSKKRFACMKTRVHGRFARACMGQLARAWRFERAISRAGPRRARAISHAITACRGETYYIGYETRRRRLFPDLSKEVFRCLSNKHRGSLFFPLSVWQAWMMLREAVVGKFVKPFVAG